MKSLAEGAGRDDSSGLQPGDMVTLLSVYAGRFGSYTTLLWQVPALGLTAQAFLMTIVLGTGSATSRGAQLIASALSIIVAYASIQLMHNQRARAINHAELVKRISYNLSLTSLLGGSFSLDDAIPGKGANAQNVWAVNRVIYAVWAGCMALFAVTGAVVMISIALGTSWFT